MNDSEILDILMYNQGFDNPRSWISYAHLHDFKKVSSVTILRCPDCGSAKFKLVGQYVYYSQLIRLKRCRRCLLRFSDVAVDPDVITEHFETTYKDEQYFSIRRQPVFEHTAEVVARNLRPGASIMDAGGALGHLACILSRMNRDYRISISDISSRSCDLAAGRWGLVTLRCSIEELSRHSVSVDCLLLIDVLYYVADIRAAWYSIATCIKPGGRLIIRLPNKLWRIEAVQFLRRMFPKSRLATSVHGFNPEHRYGFSRKYIKRRLHGLGFVGVRFCPSQIGYTGNAIVDFALKTIFGLCVAIHYLTLKKIVLTPAMLVLARK